MLIRVEGIVIRTTDYGEGNKILGVFTKQSGKVSIMARGAKKVKSRFSAVSQLFTYGEFMIFKSAGNSMGSLNSAEIIESHHLLREELYVSAYAAYLAELTERLVQDGEMYPGLFEQLSASFHALEEGKDPAIVAHLYEMKILVAAGYSPELFACVFCGRELGEAAGLSIEHGGTVCADCGHRDSQLMRMNPGVLKLLRVFQRMDLNRLGQIQVTDETKSRLKQFMRGYMDRHIGIRWKSLAFLDQMEKYDL